MARLRLVGVCKIHCFLYLAASRRTALPSRLFGLRHEADCIYRRDSPSTLQHDGLFSPSRPREQRRQHHQDFNWGTAGTKERRTRQNHAAFLPQVLKPRRSPHPKFDARRAKRTHLLPAQPPISPTRHTTTTTKEGEERKERRTKKTTFEKNCLLRETDETARAR